MTFARKTLVLAVAAVSLSLGLAAQTPASAHEHLSFGFGFHAGHSSFSFHDSFSFPERAPHPVVDVEVQEVPVYKVCPVGMHLGPYGHYCWPNSGYSY